MRNEHSTERLDYTSAQQQEEKPHYTPRPKFHRVMAWILAGVVLFAFLGTCYRQVLTGGGYADSRH